MDMLRHIFLLQDNLQDKIRSKNGEPDIIAQTVAQRVEAIKGNIFALEHELHELVDEMSWKDWTVGEPYINRDAAVKELVDVLCFFLNICLHLGVTPDELLTRYVEKNVINHRRQDESYDGVTTKCPNCRRALDDGYVALIGDGVYVCTCGASVPSLPAG